MKKILLKENSNGRKVMAPFHIRIHILSGFIIILKREEHHKKKTFKEEYIEFLNQFEIEHKPEYLFEWID